VVRTADYLRNANGATRMEARGESALLKPARKHDHAHQIEYGTC